MSPHQGDDLYATLGPGVTMFSLFLKPVLTREAFEASRSFRAYSRDTNALPSRLADAVLRRSSANAAAASEIVLANDDETVACLVPSAVVTNVAGYKLCKPTIKALWSNVVSVLLAVGMVLSVGIVCYLTLSLVTSNEDVLTKMCGVGGSATAMVAVIRGVAGTRQSLIDIVRLLSGKGTANAERCFSMIANCLSVVTTKGLIYSRTDDEFHPAFLPWSEVGSARLEGDSNGCVLILDREGSLITRLYFPSTETMTGRDVLDLVREKIGEASGLSTIHCDFDLAG